MVTAPIRGLTTAGPGVFVRQVSRVSPDYLAEHGVRWVCVPVRVQKGKTNRDLRWYHRALELDLVVSTFDWLPLPDRWEAGLSDAISFSRDAGAVAFVLNAEREFRRAVGGRRVEADAAAYADRSRALVGDMALGLVSYSVPRTIGDFPWRAFAERVDFGIPEVYDREGAFDPDYDDRAISSWRSFGFRTVIPACGIYQRDATNKPFRWRTAEEVRRHLSIFSSTSPASWLAWPLNASPPPPATLRALAEGPRAG